MQRQCGPNEFWKDELNENLPVFSEIVRSNSRPVVEGSYSTSRLLYTKQPKRLRRMLSVTAAPLWCFLDGKPTEGQWLASLLSLVLWILPSLPQNC